jgi:c-di-GMP-binding flagellar brake protein YcgR
VFVTILVIIVVVAGVMGLVLSRSNSNDKKSWVNFFAKGKDAGFSIKEIELLRRLAVKSALADPSSLFWSQNQLDSCIKNLVRSIHLAGGCNQDTQDFLSKLYDYRKKVEMQKPKIKTGITNSRQIEEGQPIRILVNNTGVFPSKIVKNIGQYLTIARPVDTKLPTGFSWIGLTLSVYFWREDDAGYVFDTEVEDEVYSRTTPSLKINHGENLFRTQKRRSIRIKTHIPAYLYILQGNSPSRNIEMEPGLRCFIEDLSDTGCAILIGGKAATGLRVKVQFILDDMPICLSGTVRSMETKEAENKSHLHIEADPMVLETRNQILGQVFQMLPEHDEELPFRIIENESEDQNSVDTIEVSESAKNAAKAAEIAAEIAAVETSTIKEDAL